MSVPVAVVVARLELRCPDVRDDRDILPNPDFVDVVIQEYRHAHATDPGDPHYAPLEAKLASAPSITVPSLVLHGDRDAVHPVARPLPTMRHFVPGTERRVVAGAGHFLPREDPTAVADALMSLLAAT